MLVDSNLKSAKTVGSINPMAMMNHLRQQFPGCVKKSEVSALNVFTNNFSAAI